MIDAPENHPLRIMLPVAVQLRILEFDRNGGPSDADYELARETGQELSSRGDVLLFGGKKGEAAGIFNRVAKAVAALAYCPGGVTLFGERYAAGPRNPRKRRPPPVPPRP